MTGTLRFVFCTLAWAAVALTPAALLPVAAQSGRTRAESLRPELVPATGHSNAVTALAYSPDGKFLASVGRDRAGRIWNGHTGLLLRTLTGINSPLLAVAFSVDSHTVFTAAANGSVQAWSAETGRRLGRTEPTGAVTAIALRPTGQTGQALLVARALPDRSITLARYKSLGAPPQVLPSLKGHESEIGALQFSPSGKLLASGGKNGLVKLWDLDHNVLKYDLKSHAMPIHALAFSEDGNTLADASEDGETRRWNVETGKEAGSPLQLNAPGDGVNAVAFAPDGNTMATGGRRSLADKQAYVVIWDAGAQKEKQTLVGHTGYVTALAFSRDGLLASGSVDHTVRIWHVATGKQIATSGVHVVVTCVAMSPTSPLLASGSTDSAVRIWSTKTGELLRILRGHTGAVNAVAFLPDGSLLISGGKDGSLRVWNPATGALLKTLETTNGETTALAISSDGSVIAAGHHASAASGAIELRDGKTFALLKTLDYRGLRPIESLAFSPDNATLASGGGTRYEGYAELRLWNAKNGEQIASETIASSGAVMALAFSPNGTLLASANDKIKHAGDLRESYTGELQIWNGKTLAFQRAAPLATPETWANSVTFLDDQTVLSGGEDGLLRRWNAQTGEKSGLFGSQHLGPVAAIGRSRDGQLLASCAADNTVRLWSASKGELLATLATLPGHAAPAESADPAPSGDWLAATPDGYYDGSANATRLIQWRVGPDLFPLDSFEAMRHRPEVVKRSLAMMATESPIPPKGDTIPPPKPQIKHRRITGGVGKVPPPGRQDSVPPVEATPSERLLSPPQISFAEPASGATIDGDTLRISGWVTDTDEIKSIALQVNGRTLKPKSLLIGVKSLMIGVKSLLIGDQGGPADGRRSGRPQILPELPGRRAASRDRQRDRRDGGGGGQRPPDRPAGASAKANARLRKGTALRAFGGREPLQGPEERS